MPQDSQMPSEDSPMMMTEDDDQIPEEGDDSPTSRYGATAMVDPPEEYTPSPKSDMQKFKAMDLDAEDSGECQAKKRQKITGGCCTEEALEAQNSGSQREIIQIVGPYIIISCPM